MNEVITVPAGAGKLIVDFEQKRIVIDREGISPMTGWKSMSINFKDITDIELKAPAGISLGSSVIIVNNIRYVTTANMDMTKFAVKKDKFELLESTLKRVLSECNLNEFKELGSVPAPKVVYTPENDPMQSAAQYEFNKKKTEAEEANENIDIFTEAKLFAQSVELQLLKAPASAKFCALEEMTVTEINGIYTVSGYVDSQNSYAAMVRTPFTLKVFKTENGWKCADQFQSTQANIHKTVAKNMALYWILGLIFAGVSFAIIYAIISNLY